MKFSLGVVWGTVLDDVADVARLNVAGGAAGGGALRPLAGPRRRGSPEEALGGARELDAIESSNERVPLTNPAFGGYYRFGTVWGRFVMPGGSHFLGGEFSFSGYFLFWPKQNHGDR